MSTVTLNDDPSVSHTNVTRRTMLGAAWAAPVVLAVSATPAFAASPDVPVFIFLATAVDEDGYTLVVRIEHANFQPWANADFRVQLFDEGQGDWVSLPMASTDSNGDWSTRVDYQDVPLEFTQARVLFSTSGVDYTSTPLYLPPPPPTITIVFQQDVQDTWDIFTQFTPRLSGPYAVDYQVQRQDPGGSWSGFANSTTDASGAGLLTLPNADITGYVAIRTRIVINTYSFYSNVIPV